MQVQIDTDNFFLDKCKNKYNSVFQKIMNMNTKILTDIGEYKYEFKYYSPTKLNKKLCACI